MPASPVAIFTPTGGGGSPSSPAEVFEPSGAGGSPSSPVEIFVQGGADGAPASLTVSGTLTDGTDPVVFPTLPDIGTNDGKSMYLTSNHSAIWHAGAGGFWNLEQDEPRATWRSTEDVASPDLVETWAAVGAATGTPVVTGAGAAVTHSPVEIHTPSGAGGSPSSPVEIHEPSGAGGSPSSPVEIHEPSGAGGSPSSPVEIHEPAGAGGSPSSPAGIFEPADTAASYGHPAQIFGRTSGALIDGNVELLDGGQPITDTNP